MFARLPLTLLALCATCFAVGPDLLAQQRVEAPSAGFSIEIDADWSSDTQESGGRLTSLKTGPKDRPGIVQLTLLVSESSESGAEASQAVVDQLAAQVAGVAHISIEDRIDLEIDGDKAFGIEVLQEDSGINFRVRLYFLCRNGFQYRMQFHAPDQDFDDLWPTAQRAMQSIRKIEVDEGTSKRQQLLALAQRCGSEIEWAEDWKSAVRAAKRERKLIVVAIHSIPGFNLGSPLMTGPFSDPDVVGLMQQRFVGFVWQPGVEAEFARPDGFGLGPNTFGSGVLIVKPDGEIIRQVFLPQALFVFETLCEVLQGSPKLGCPKPQPGSSRAELAQHWIDCGEFERAKQVLATPESGEDAEIALQRGRLLRLQRQGEAALRALQQAPPTAATQVELTLAHLGVGNAEQAEITALMISNYEPSPNQAAYADLLVATFQLYRGELDAAIQSLEGIAEAWPDTSSAWIAASALTGPSLQATAATPIDLSWPSEEAFAFARIPAAAEPGASAEDMLTGAVDWLLDNQDKQGRWQTPSGIQDAQSGRDQISMASQIISVQALFEFATQATDTDQLAARCRSAAMLGLRSYLADSEETRAHPRPVAYMDYTCWGSSYGAFGLASVLSLVESGKLQLLPEELEAVGQELKRCVADLVQIQQANGGWSYYLSGEIDGAATVAAMSFTTATVLNALHAGRDHGVSVEDSVLESGYACLEALRGTNGNFDYLTLGADLPTTGEITAPGSAGRGPLCVRTLVQAERLSADELAPAFETYIDHLPGFGRESRKALMHAGVDAQGSHYLTYDYATGAEALADAPKGAVKNKLRKRVRSAILTELSKCRSANGSFIDNPIIGPAAGTGLAVQCLVDLGIRTD